MTVVEASLSTGGYIAAKEGSLGWQSGILPNTLTSHTLEKVPFNNNIEQQTTDRDSMRKEGWYTK